MTSRVRSSLSRRAFLVAGGLTTATQATGCATVDDLLNDDEPSQSPEPESSDDRLVADALADQERLLASCLAVRARHESLRGSLAPLVEHHREHVRVLGGEPSSRRSRSGVASSPRKSLVVLGRMERAAAKRRAHDAQRAESGELARVLAAISASLLQHEYVLNSSIGGGS
ncbi:MAG TPA: hypothetical protein VK059_13560 [Nocardioidaceae bacterium]|nr:hypothetical protein [Nocardioidaceae bacterium]